MERPEPEYKPERPAQELPPDQLPGFDFLRDWAAQLGLDKRTRETDSQRKEEKPAPELNQWVASPGPDKNTDKISMTADYTIPRADFYRANPKAPQNLKDIKQDDRFLVRHPTTGEVDGGWRIVGSGDQQVRLQRDYSMVVQKGKHAGFIEALPGVPASFVEQLQKKLDQLPQNVKDNLRDAGYKIIATAKITDALPGLRGLSPRGWSRTSTFDNSDGTHDNVSKRIVMPMKVKWGSEDWQDVSRPEVLTHQIGHALDFASGFLSNRKEFNEAFLRDTSRSTDRNHDIFKYFSQPEGAGKQEAFATLFGLALTGPENESDRQYLEKTFPKTLEAVQGQIKGLSGKKR